MQARNILTNLSPSPARLITLHNGVASPKKIEGGKMFDFRRITLQYFVWKNASQSTK